MCGLTYYHKTDNKSVSKAVLKRYEAQKSRGTQGFGFVGFSLNDMQVKIAERMATEKDMKTRMHEIKDEDVNAILFHHRFPTSTPNIAECAHPIKVDNNELEYIYYVAHNGVISNDDKLKEKHEALGYEYMTEIEIKEVIQAKNGQVYERPTEVKYNDSEAVAIEMARRIEGKSDKIEAEGSMALIALQVSREGKALRLYYGRNYRNPLYLEKDNLSFCLKSEGAHGDSVEGHELFCLDYATGEITQEPCDFGSRWGSTQTSTYGFDSRRTTTEGQQSLLPAATEPTEPPTTTAPDMTATEYFEQTSMTEFSIHEMVKQGYELEEIENEILDEFNFVEELLDWEKMLKFDKKLIERLEERSTALDNMLGLIIDLKSIGTAYAD